MFMTDPLVQIYRGGILESEHRGGVAVVDKKGFLIAHAGDPMLVSFLRSTAKPFQALPVISSGAAHRFGFSLDEIAIMTGSHSGEPAHVSTVQSILEKIHLPESSLKCGVHPPFHPLSFGEPRVLHNNCSGKHAGMLALAVDKGLSTDDYLKIDHPVQIAIREGLSEIAQMADHDIKIGIDGCSAPTFALPLMKAALLFSKLAGPRMEELRMQPSSPTLKSIVGDGRTWSRTDALAFISQAMTEFPYMVGGTGRFDTDIMIALKNRIVCKSGAEGYLGAGVFDTKMRKLGIEPPFGIAIKIADGNGRRGLPPVLIEVLNQLGVLDKSDLEKLREFHSPMEYSHAGLEVGQAKAEFQLRWC
jgi:L-asparaginase II